MIRNPVDRELSAYFYIKTWQKHPRHNFFKNYDLYQFIEHKEKEGFQNPQCTYICGEASFQKAKEAISEKYFLVAPTDYIKQFLLILKKAFDLKIDNFKHENRTRFRLSEKEIHPKLKRRFEALTEDDIKLYSYVKSKFEKEYFESF